MGIGSENLSPSRGDGVVSTVLASVVIIGAGLLARQAVEASYTRATDDPPPNNPADKGVSWPRALAWAAMVGAVVGVARATARRWATTRL